MEIKGLDKEIDEMKIWTGVIENKEDYIAFAHKIFE